MDDQPVRLAIELAVRPDEDTEDVAKAALRLSPRAARPRRRGLGSITGPGTAPRDQGGGAGGAWRAGRHSRQVAVGRSIVAMILWWLAGAPQHSIKLEQDVDVLELSGLSSKEQR